MFCTANIGGYYIDEISNKKKIRITIIKMYADIFFNVSLSKAFIKTIIPSANIMSTIKANTLLTHQK